jgi:hypothetical protein
MMKATLSCIAALVLFIPPQAWAQSSQADPFNGTWRLNVARSTATWQAHAQPKIATPQPQAFELATIKVADTTMDYSVEYARGNEPHKKANFTAKYNDAKWREIQGTADGAYASLTLVKSTDRIRYMVTRAKDGQFAGIILNKLADDGRSFTSVGFGGDGYVQYVRVFEKQ